MLFKMCHLCSTWTAGGGGEGKGRKEGRKKTGRFHYALHACWMSAARIISDCLWQADRNAKDEQPELHATEKRSLWKDYFPNSRLPCHKVEADGSMKCALSQQRFIDITAISCKYCANVKDRARWTACQWNFFFFFKWGMYFSDSPAVPSVLGSGIEGCDDEENQERWPACFIEVVLPLLAIYKWYPSPQDC